MEYRELLIDPRKCNGCGECEIVCSLECAHIVNPVLSRIRVVEWKTAQNFLPVACCQCEDAPCVAVCPKEALSRDDKLHRVVLDYRRCISCRMCVAACPFGAMRFDADRQMVFKCDLCNGNPQCVRFCAPGALQFAPSERERRGRVRQAASRQIGIKETRSWPTSG